jgi:hypothetical protein
MMGWINIMNRGLSKVENRGSELKGGAIELLLALKLSSKVDEVLRWYLRVRSYGSDTDFQILGIICQCVSRKL